MPSNIQFWWSCEVELGLVGTNAKMLRERKTVSCANEKSHCCNAGLRITQCVMRIRSCCSKNGGENGIYSQDEICRTNNQFTVSLRRS